MNYFFIDYENVHQSGLNGISRLTKKSVVYIFYSYNANTMALDSIKEIVSALTENKKIKIKFRETYTGHNALDFQLSSELGYVIRKTKPEKDKYYIVSKDRGFKCLEKYWAEKDIRVYCINEVARYKIRHELGGDKKLRRGGFTPENVMPYVGDKKLAKSAANALNVGKDRNHVYMLINKEFHDTNRAAELYHKIKHLV